MSLSSTTSGAISQQSSQLLLLPTELRRAIYAQLLPPRVHLSLHQGKLLVSACVNVGSEDDDGSERKSSGDMRTDETWARRLQSSWGTHWECEETRSQQMMPDIISIILACKMICRDVFAFMPDHLLHINLTDLDTLEYLSQNAENTSLSRNIFLSQSLAWLDLSLRFPARLCQAIENLGPDKTPLRINDHCASQLSSWQRFPQTISKFKKLRKIRISLDHDDPSSWAIVNERALVAPILPLTHTEGLDLSVVLPKLHPEYDLFKWQYSPRGPAPEFTLHRRQRQAYFTERHVCLTRCISVIHEKPFPVYADLAGADIMGDWEMVTVTDIAYLERGIWSQGEDLDEELFGSIPISSGPF